MRPSALWVLLLLPALALAQEPTGAPRVGVRFTDGPLPLDPASGSWSGAVPVSIPLQAQNFVPPMGGGSVKEVAVRGLHNGSHVAFLVEWEDATRDAAPLLNRTWDGAALMFPLQAGASAIMGNAGGTVNIWQWRADWQEELDKGRRAGYPEYADFYRDDTQTGFAAVGMRPRHGTPVDDLSAEGPGTLTRQDRQDVGGRGIYSGGGWSTVFVRRLSTGDPADAEFRAGEDDSLNVAVWSGSEGDVGAKKSVSLTWTAVGLDALPPLYLRLLPVVVMVSALLGGAVVLWRMKM